MDLREVEEAIVDALHAGPKTVRELAGLLGFESPHDDVLKGAVMSLSRPRRTTVEPNPSEITEVLIRLR